MTKPVHGYAVKWLDGELAFDTFHTDKKTSIQRFLWSQCVFGLTYYEAWLGFESAGHRCVPVTIEEVKDD